MCVCVCDCHVYKQVKSKFYLLLDVTEQEV